ncbi:hypothetical protein EV189_1658 [Motilibacter rhizosphaerae]|uniref:Uncharacterized protein n=1 Tax=Motilibacter rhizosphaerae TaxID=598652 RepID=A0A4Q7NS23_9ACTN|nr:hypothetical protein EV189_1658 [Motilibacter rhizosphaerae]
MSTRHTTRPTGAQWAKLKGSACVRAAQRQDFEAPLDLSFRIFLLASGLAGPGGHAPLELGRLQQELLRLNRSTGELGPYGERHLRGAISTLVKAELLAPTSSLRCLVLPLTVWDMGTRYKIQDCPQHGHALAWSGGPNGQWFDPHPHAVAAALRDAGSNASKKGS